MNNLCLICVLYEEALVLDLSEFMVLSGVREEDPFLFTRGNITFTSLPGVPLAQWWMRRVKEPDSAWKRLGHRYLLEGYQSREEARYRVRPC